MGRSTVNGTKAVHGGEPRAKAHDAITHPISATATYVFRDTDELRDHFEHRIEREEYGRYGNPTVRIAEQKLAALDSAEDAVCFGSGMSAITTTLLAMLRQGHHVVMTADCYRRTRQFVTSVLARFGVESTLVPPGDYEALEAAIQPGRTRLIIAESPTNPYLHVADLERLVAIRDRHRGVKIMIDSTFATPINQRPIEWGVDLVTHSCTKYLGGHNDLLAGVVCGKASLIGAIRDFRGVLGGVLDPHAAYLLIRGIKTLELRVKRQNETALAVARWLEQHPRIDTVYYPGLESHPGHLAARAQMDGFGGVVSFLVDSDEEGTAAFIDACTIPQIGPSLGGVESLIEQPALMSFYELTTEQRQAIGIHDNLVRFAIGIEDTDDLIQDLERALEAVPANIASPTRQAR
ncbi:MAG: cystathionine gamma-synthase [Myxococcales bacterium]|nr:cystathionine gamma-synthase [Myxococcales bacterium]